LLEETTKSLKEKKSLVAKAKMLKPVLDMPKHLGNQLPHVAREKTWLLAQKPMENLVLKKQMENNVVVVLMQVNLVRSIKNQPSKTKI
jgi:hypothetical protein